MSSFQKSTATGNKQVLVVFETYSHFSDAGARLKELVRSFGKGGSIKRSDSGFSILATPELLARIESDISASSSLVAEVAPPAALTEPRISRDTLSESASKASSAVAKVPASASNLASGKVSVEIARSPPSPPRANVSSARTAFPRDRLDRMVAELRQAYNRLPSSTAAAWGAMVVKQLGLSFTRRVGNVVDLGIFLLEKTGSLVIDFSKATIAGRPIEHTKQLGEKGIAAGAKFVESSTNSLRSLIADLRSKPEEVAPELLISALAFFVVGGGLDGDGGIPDCDIQLFGIGGHRSIFTHSIVAGTIIETSLYSLIHLVVITHGHLPKGHDPLWDSILLRSQSITQSAARGSSAGLAYHLAVDSVVQPGLYRDLPFSASLGVHEAITAANAASEAKEAGTSRPETTRKKHPPSNQSSEKSGANTAAEIDMAKIGKVAVGGAVALVGWLLS